MKCSCWNLGQTWLPNSREGITLCCQQALGHQGHSRGRERGKSPLLQGRSLWRTPVLQLGVQYGGHKVSKDSPSVPFAPPQGRTKSPSLHLMGLLSSCLRVECTAVTCTLASKTGIPQPSTLLNCLAKQYFQM